MQTELAVSAPSANRLVPDDCQAAVEIDLSRSGSGFRTLTAAFRPSGGIARADDLARLLCDRGDGGQGDPILDELLSRAEVFGLTWRGKVWLPMFQFDLRRLSVQRAPQRVRAELQGTSELDGWDCASWFARPHAELNHHAPVDLLVTDLQGVLNVARADRWVLNG